MALPSSPTPSNSNLNLGTQRQNSGQQASEPGRLALDETGKLLESGKSEFGKAASGERGSSEPESGELETARRERENVRVGAVDARSWLLVSALHPENFDTAQLSRADQIVLDLEDAVDDSLKDHARADVLEWLSGGGCAWVRINDWTTPYWADDLAGLVGAPGLAGVMLAKTEEVEHLSDTFQRLGGTVPVIALVESAIGIENADHIARTRGIFRLAFGGGDYRRDTGAANDDLAMAYPRSRLVVASRLGRLPGPIDGPTVGGTHPVLREGTQAGVVMGMTGKLCLDVDQSPIINECMSPSPADVAWALDFLRDFDRGGRIIRDGSDKPRLARAETIARRADIFRINPA